MSVAETTPYEKNKRIPLPKETHTQMITRLRLKNFLSYKDVAINFTDFNVVVGANASGKTNLIKALKALRFLILNGFTSSEDFEVFMQAHFNKNSPESEPMVFEIDIENPATIDFKDKSTRTFNKHKYLLHLEYGKGVVKESYQAFEKGQTKPYKILERTDAEVKFSNTYNPTKPLDESITEQSALKRLKFYPLAGKLSSAFLMMIIQAFCNHLFFYALNPLAIIGYSGGSNQKIVNENGSNLAGVLQYYKEHNTVVVDSINEILKRSIPNFISVDTKKVVGNNYVFYVNEADGKEYMLNELSDGTDVYIAMVTAMITSQYIEIPEQYKGVMVLEEPETSLHPQLMEELVDLAKSLTHKFQIIITTHSTDIVSHLNPEDLLLLDKTTEGTRIKRASEFQEIKEYLKEFSLDQIWLNNDLKGGTIDA